MGIAPLLFLAKQLKSKEKIALIGIRNKNQVLCEKEFKDLGWYVKIATDDGSVGFKGRVTDLLINILQANRQILRRAQDASPKDAERSRSAGKQATLYACGPKPMLKEVCSISLKYKIPAEVSLEEHMSCGIGACLGCVVQTKEGYKRVCKEGPVFSAKDIVW